MFFCYAVTASSVEVDRTDEKSCTSFSRLWLLDWTVCILLIRWWFVLEGRLIGTVTVL